MDGMGAFLADSLVNLVSSLGASKDAGSQSRFFQAPRLTRYEIDAIYNQSWIGGKVVDLRAEDCCREWRMWNGSKEAVKALEATEKRLKLVEKVRLTLKRAAKDGGAALLIGTNEDPATPFVPSRLGKDGLLYLHAVTRWDLSVGMMNRDPMSPWFGEPIEYRLMMPNGGSVGVHPSRVIKFVVTTQQDPMMTGEPWGDSIYERLRDPVRDLTATMQGIASLVQESKIDVFQVPDLTRNVRDENYRRAVLQRFTLANTLKSINNALVMDASEKFEQKSYTFGGLPEIVDRLLLVVSGAADIPITRLFGRSPGGLNATGVSDLEQYYTSIRATQENLIRPILAPLDEAIVRSTFGRTPRTTGYEFRSLWSLSAQENADVRLKHAQAVKVYGELGIFERQSLARATGAALEEDSFLPGLTPAPEEQQPEAPTTSPESET